MMVLGPEVRTSGPSRFPTCSTASGLTAYTLQHPIVIYCTFKRIGIKILALPVRFDYSASVA
jgi:hypothetical protein